MPPEFGEFIQEEHAVVRQRHLPRRRHLVAADQPDIGNGIRRCPKGPHRHQGGAAFGAAGVAVDVGGVKGFGQGDRRQEGSESPDLGHSCLTPPFPPRKAMACLREGKRPHALAGAENIPYSPHAVGPAASPERSPVDGVDHVVNASHPRHAGEHEVHTGVVLLRRGGGTAIPHHHALVILVEGVPQRPLDHPCGRVPRQDQGRDA
jgi:hypothetical protein